MTSEKKAKLVSDRVSELDSIFLLKSDLKMYHKRGQNVGGLKHPCVGDDSVEYVTATECDASHQEITELHVIFKDMLDTLNVWQEARVLFLLTPELTEQITYMNAMNDLSTKLAKYNDQYVMTSVDGKSQ